MSIYEIANVFAQADQLVSFPENTRELFSRPSKEVSFGQVLGDDSVVFSNAVFCTWYDKIVGPVGMTLSPGKDFQSQYTGQFCEQFCFRTSVTENFQYHDTLKARYLSPFSKAVGIEQDSRDPALTKAGPLARVVKYYNEPENERFRFAKERIELIYKCVYPRVWKLADRYPIGISAFMGGLSVPICNEEEYLREWVHYTALMNGVMNLSNAEFVSWAFRLGHLAVGSKKGLIAPLSESTLFVEGVANSIRNGELVTSIEVRGKLEALGKAIPMRGHHTNWRRVGQMAKEFLNLQPLTQLLSEIDRIEAFQEALAGHLDAEDAVVKIRLHHYTAAFDRIMKDLVNIPVTADDHEPYKTIDELFKRFYTKLADVYVPTDHPCLSLLEFGPSLFIELASMRS